MDYDQTKMPSAYDAGRSYAPAVLAFWLGVISRWVPKGTVADIVDIGCGTGRYSAALANYFDARVIALDPSEKMLAEARKKAAPPRVHYERASGEALPLRDASVDLAFMSMVFHHLAYPESVARECRRVLRPNGAACLRAGTVERSGSYAYVPFFPGARSILNKSLTSQARIESVFAAAGFCLAGHELVPSQAAENWNAYAQKLAHRADSTLIQVSDREFEQGLAVLRDYAAARPTNERVIEPIDFFVFRPA
ncbi:MAG TPA: class I SAM-dependent methyltransferase [Candidatus Binataceae bacterium]|nr:class I SAM-dependent methyltransferase [Candidatus Binataceae bacterium]